MAPRNLTIVKAVLVVAICCICGAPGLILAANPDSSVPQPLFMPQARKGADNSGIHLRTAPTGLRRMLKGDHTLTLRDFNFEPQSVDVSSQVDPVQVFKLALENFPFLSGLNTHYQRLEKWCDRQAKKIGLCGAINLSKKLPAPVNKIDHSVPGIPLAPEGVSPYKVKKHESHWFPETISWRIGYDMHNSSVLGKIKVGRYISVIGETGSQGKVTAMLNIDF